MGTVRILSKLSSNAVMRNSYLILVISLLTLCSATCEASWLLYHKPEFKGRVVDIDTKQPIEGAVVVAIYYKSTLNPPAGSYSNVIHVKETLTDKDGRFRFPAYTTLIHPLSYSGNCEFLIYKPGYGCLGKLPMESRFSGNAASNYEEVPYWNKRLFFRYLTNGTVEIPRLKNKEEMEKAWMNARVWSLTDIEENEFTTLSKIIHSEEHNFIER